MKLETYTQPVKVFGYFDFMRTSASIGSLIALAVNQGRAGGEEQKREGERERIDREIYKFVVINHIERGAFFGIIKRCNYNVQLLPKYTI